MSGEKDNLFKMKFKMIISWFKQYWLAIVIVVTIVGAPVIIGQLLHRFNWNNGSNDGWLGFWGGYLGAGIAILGVYWQVDRTNKSEKESQFRMSRPFFILKKINSAINISSEKNYYFLNDGIFLNSSEDITNYLTTKLENNDKEIGKILTIDISNPSSKKMMAVYIKVNYGGEIEEYRIESINPNHIVHLIFRSEIKKYAISKIKKFKDNKDATGVFSLYEDLSGDNQSTDIDKAASFIFEKYNNINVDIDSIVLYFTTELRERIKLVFETENGVLNYDKNKKILENKDKNDKDKIKDLDENYRTSDFKQSITIRKIHGKEKMTVVKNGG